MRLFRNIVLFLAILQLIFTAFTGVVGAFADGGDILSHLLLIVIHPVCAVGLLLLALRPCPSRMVTFNVLGLLVLNVGADLALSLAITQGWVKGDFWLPLVFAVIPATAATYALKLSVKGSQPG